jgi:hypothetical protein
VMSLQLTDSGLVMAHKTCLEWLARDWVKSTSESNVGALIIVFDSNVKVPLESLSFLLWWRLLSLTEGCRRHPEIYKLPCKGP